MKPTQEPSVRSDEIFPYYWNRSKRLHAATGYRGKAEILSAATVMSALCRSQ
jgi:hypothetical protein